MPSGNNLFITTSNHFHIKLLTIIGERMKHDLISVGVTEHNFHYTLGLWKKYVKHTFSAIIEFFV